MNKKKKTQLLIEIPYSFRSNIKDMDVKIDKKLCFKKHFNAQVKKAKTIMV